MFLAILSITILNWDLWNVISCEIVLNKVDCVLYTFKEKYILRSLIAKKLLMKVWHFPLCPLHQSKAKNAKGQRENTVKHVVSSVFSADLIFTTLIYDRSW